ncbi:MAG: exodeoxyribonuclease VII large subunit, partial [Lactobacillales bacterium]|nr:exodeoxyribonuclease VII large subunit [Lactobacillales bacterium]
MIEPAVFSVSDISNALKNVVEKNFSHVFVRGEISGLKKAPSGHLYFSLKDKDAVLSAVCWKGRSGATLGALTEGLEVICFGKLSTYPGRSNYQMIVESAEPAGVGALLKLLNERKEKLQKEGLFEAAHKKPIPFLPGVIGVITSPTGAVIKDILHRLSDRFPRHVILWPVLVQGEGAADQITAAINGFNALPDTGLQTKDGLVLRPDV